MLQDEERKITETKFPKSQKYIKLQKISFTLKITVFWDVILHLQGRLMKHVPLQQWKIHFKVEGTISQTTVISEDITMRTSNSTQYWHM
jgi:hypothetical protein